MTTREPPTGLETLESFEWESEHDFPPETDVKELEEIDAWVARAEGFKVVQHDTAEGHRFAIQLDGIERPVPAYTRSEELAQPIIEREGIELQDYVDFGVPYTALATIERPGIQVTPCVGYTELEAAMACYVAMKFGDAALDGASPAMG